MRITIAAITKLSHATCSKTYSPAAIPQVLARSKASTLSTFPNAPHGARQWCPSAEIRAHLKRGDVESCLPIVAKAYEAAHPSLSDNGASLTRLRLVTTTLIHGLLKHGNATKASDVVADTLQGRVPLSPTSTVALPIHCRVRLHTRTLDRTISILAQGAGESTCQSRVTYLRDHRDLRHWRSVVGAQLTSRDPSSLNMLPNPSRSNENIRRSVALLNAFRRHRYHRTENMYERVVEACLLQGEIVTATLLFVLLVRDWQVKRTMQAAVAAINDTPEGPNLNINESPSPSINSGRTSSGKTERLLARCAGATGIPSDEIKACGLLQVRLPHPNNGILKRLLDSINQSGPLVVDPGGHMSSWEFLHCDAKEALAYLACLLHEHAIPESRLSSLIRAISRHSQSQDVPLTSNGVRRSWRMCMRGPDSPSFRDLPSPDARMVVHLVQRSTRSCNSSVNTICFETLRGLIDPTPRHGGHSFKMPLLDQRSYNALLYFGLRNAKSLDLTRATLHLMHERGVKADIVTLNTLLRGASLLRMNRTVQHLVQLIDDVFSRSNPPAGSLTSVLASSMRMDSRESENEDAQSRNTYLADSILTSLTPLSMEPRLIPDLYTLSSILAHRTSIGIDRSLAFRVLAIVVRHIRELRVDIVFLTAILNMLVKAGMMGAAKAVFVAMKSIGSTGGQAAETTATSPMLNIYACAIMLQMYAGERRKHVSPRGGTDRTRHSEALHPYPHSNTPDSDAALRAGIELYHTVSAESRKFANNPMIGTAKWMSSVDPHAAHVDIPIPDARFFNAALSLVSRSPSSVRRRRWPRRPGQSFAQTYRLSGSGKPPTASALQLDILSKIKSDMEEFFSSSPLGVHWLLRSRPNPRTPPIPDSTPRFREHPFRITTLKMRGLPVRRKVISRP